MFISQRQYIIHLIWYSNNFCCSDGAQILRAEWHVVPASWI